MLVPQDSRKITRGNQQQRVDCNPQTKENKCSLQKQLSLKWSERYRPESNAFDGESPVYRFETIRNRVFSVSTYDAIYAIVRQIPYGKVATYGQVAELASLPRQARLVGYALYRVDMQLDDVPWHRVINAKGEVSESPFRYGTDYLQRSLLEQEGVVFSKQGKVSLRQYRWQPDIALICAYRRVVSEGADGSDTCNSDGSSPYAGISPD